MSLSGFIAYQRVGWTGQTPWNPTNLNIMDKGIKDNNDMIANLRSEVSALNNNIDVKNCFCKNIEIHCEFIRFSHKGHAGCGPAFCYMLYNFRLGGLA